MFQCALENPFGKKNGFINFKKIMKYDKSNETLDFNGKIEPSKQGEDKSDCWLLGVINSLSYSEAGEEKIEEILSYGENQTTVKLYNNNVKIENEEILEAKKENTYSTGDDDVKVIEIAIEKALDEYNNGNKNIIDKKLRFEEKFGDEDSSLNNGYTFIAYYLLTGKIAKYITPETKKEKLDKFLNDFKNNNGKNIFAVCSHRQNSEIIQDNNGANVKLYKNHTYSIKEINDKNAIIYDPIENIDINVSLEVLKEKFDNFEYDFLQ